VDVAECGFTILIVHEPSATATKAQASCLLSVVLLSCIVKSITASACIVELVSTNCAFVVAAKATAANVITPDVVLSVTPVA